jgi:hypothetical protein
LIAGTTWAFRALGNIAPAATTAKASALERSRMFVAREINSLILRCLEISKARAKNDPSAPWLRLPSRNAEYRQI